MTVIKDVLKFLSASLESIYFAKNKKTKWWPKRTIIKLKTYSVLSRITVVSAQAEITASIRLSFTTICLSPSDDITKDAIPSWCAEISYATLYSQYIIVGFFLIVSTKNLNVTNFYVKHLYTMREPNYSWS